MMQIKHLIDLTIPMTLLVVATGVIIGGIVSSGYIYLSQNFIFALGAFVLMMAAFNTINGIFDIKLDKISKPHRPLPSSKITIEAAWKFYSILALAGSILAYFANIYVFIIILVVVILSILYSSPIGWFKRHMLLNTVIVTACYSILPLMAGWFVFSTSFSMPLPLFLILGLLSFGMVVIKDIEDMVADKISGITTIPVALGIERTVYILGILFSFSYILISLMALTKFLYLLSLIGYLGVIHLLLSIKKKPYPGLGKYFLLEAIAIGLFIEVSLGIVYIL